MKKRPNYLNDKISLNVLAHSVENKKECYEALEGYITLGVFTKRFGSD